MYFVPISLLDGTKLPSRLLCQAMHGHRGNFFMGRRLGVVMNFNKLWGGYANG